MIWYFNMREFIGLTEKLVPQYTLAQSEGSWPSTKKLSTSYSEAVQSGSHLLTLFFTINSNTFRFSMT
jgi:hypothetical protein